MLFKQHLSWLTSVSLVFVINTALAKTAQQAATEESTQQAAKIEQAMLEKQVRLEKNKLKKSKFENSTQAVALTITPISCQVRSNGDICHVKLNISWQAQQAINPCLYKNNIKEACWFNQRHSEIKLPVSFERDVLFTLQENDMVIAKQVVSISSQTPKYRRRLRSDWSIF
ncbi:MAG: DUF3019 domain-containing protein [Thalassotalea sp.]